MSDALPRALATFAHVRLATVPFVPEIRLHQADEPVGLWDLIGGGYSSDRPPPFWAFAWAGGQGLARYVLDHPETVNGRRVLDLAAGSGLVAIAAAMAGAATVRAVDIDADAVSAIEVNARANGVVVDAVQGDILDDPLDGRTPDGRIASGDHVLRLADVPEVVLVGDAFYSKAMADRVLAYLRRAGRNGAQVLVGDPDRAFLPHRLFRQLHAYDVPTRPALEDIRVKRTAIWELADPAAR
ncbi:methyltransferase [Planosporangium flavigriseum]|uniref:Nicotinamide N-methylase n=1 Tax=Planosporangium flavigriseum TaxID=373681 RepID=A0A8J3LSQ8_9ACTN|nr:50S ribosomal protein L11 methyltransferase [Planosporangium flavigriseum]NJC67547.1 methyltransferase [Planosporangium flavigriseum]GIG75958.1 nicotinamide N-methylase [Planosporangium flavigriseum]